jgi:hypothetical protein
MIYPNYNYLSPNQKPMVGDPNALGVLASIECPLAATATLVQIYEFEPVLTPWIAFSTVSGAYVLPPTTCRVLQYGANSGSLGMLLDLGYGVTCFIDGLASINKNIFGTIVANGVNSLGTSSGLLNFQLAYNNVVFDPLTLPNLQPTNNVYLYAPPIISDFSNKKNSGLVAAVSWA